MKILKKVIVKQVITVHSKQKLKERFLMQKQQIKKEYEQLRFELKKYENNRKKIEPPMKRQLQKEINQRLEKEKQLMFQLEQLELLPLGSELKESEVESIVEINVGDIWDEKQTIVIKDGVVFDIR